MLMLLSVHVTSVLFLVLAGNFTLTMGFYWSYMLLLQSPVLMRSCLLCHLHCTGRYIGNRPVKLRKSMWRERSLDMIKKKDKEKKKLGFRQQQSVVVLYVPSYPGSPPSTVHGRREQAGVRGQPFTFCCKILLITLSFCIFLCSIIFAQNVELISLEIYFQMHGA